MGKKQDNDIDDDVAQLKRINNKYYISTLSTINTTFQLLDIYIYILDASSKPEMKRPLIIDSSFFFL